MDIIIKSFNRPYYLDRCLQSIYKFVSGEFVIQILDDGTPPEYLNRIAELYPAAQIFRSPRYEAKVAALHRHVKGERDFDERIIPFDFWVERVQQASELFLLIEDDIWLTNPIDMTAFKEQINASNIDMVKLSWLGNEDSISGERKPLPFPEPLMEEVKPYIPFLSQTIFLNRFRVRSVLYRSRLLGLFDMGIKHQLPVYTLYAVASAFFRKSYWLNLMPAGQTTADEPAQLIRAWQWWRRTGCRFAKSTVELTSTSFITSATNTYAGVKLDPFVLSHILNGAWLRGEMDVMQNFPRDFTPDYLQSWISAANDQRATYPEWLKWIVKFKTQYRQLGFKVD